MIIKSHFDHCVNASHYLMETSFIFMKTIERLRNHLRSELEIQDLIEA